MTDIKLPPMPKPHTPPVFATAANTPSVKAGYELGGYEKTPPLFDEHQLEIYAREAVRLNATVPDGWKLVPVEPTDEMVKVGDQKTWVFPSRECWTAMLSAAPAAPQPTQADAKPIYQYQLATGGWIDQTRDSYEYNKANGVKGLRIVYEAAPAAPQSAPDWAPTPENINSLPEPVRRYIAELETNCDPAGTVRDLSIARDTIRALEASNRMLRDEAPEPAQQTCNCRWVGDVQVQQCTLHQAHVEAIHEWAERAKTAEAKLKAQQPLTDEQRKFLLFLEGAADWDGVWFGLRHPNRAGDFWWRRDMRQVFYGIGVKND